ncbi:MAG: PAC2 family protein [Actinomycetota bacterium]|nr:PAC2 family protein [Actinomycetota bacterium]
MEALRWDERPALRRPVLIAAFEGWNDGADAASWAARYLAETWSARTFATIDPEEFYDFTEVRPHVRLVDGVTRQVDWPASELSAASPPGTPHDVVFLRAAEPQLRWRAYSSLVVEVAKELGIELVLTLGALLADVAHTQDVPVTGMAADDELMRRLGMMRSRYEGPTGIVGVVHDACSSAGIATASLWASVPLYVGGTPSPKATLALVERATSLLGSQVGTVELEVAAAAYERQVSEVVAEDEDMAAYVRRLEELDAGDVDGGGGDGGDVDGQEQAGDHQGNLPSTDALAAEVERFLRDQPSE